MSTNVTVEYLKAEERYAQAKTREEKIAALEEMISACPKHKATENLLNQLKQRLAKMRKQSEAKAARRSIAIAKEGDAQICIIGLTQSGKSTLLRLLTNAKPEVSSVPYTTKKPVVGVADYLGVKLQLIEIPSSFRREFMSIAQNCDAVAVVVRDWQETNEVRNILEEFRIRKPVCEINTTLEKNAEAIKEKIWKVLGMIRVYTKEPGKPAEKKPLVLKKGSTVEEAVSQIHKDFLKYFKFARIWGSTKYPGEKVGLEHRLKDGDILEIRIS